MSGAGTPSWWQKALRPDPFAKGGAAFDVVTPHIRLPRAGVPWATPNTASRHVGPKMSPNQETNMKDESSPETSSAAASRAEQLRSLLSCVEECAQDVLRQYDRLYPALYALSRVVLKSRGIVIDQAATKKQSLPRILALDMLCTGQFDASSLASTRGTPIWIGTVDHHTENPRKRKWTAAPFGAAEPLELPPGLIADYEE